MASLVISSIRSALDDLDRSSSLRHIYPHLKYLLKNLELFVLCTRTLSNHAQPRFDDDRKDTTTLGSLLQRIHDAVSRVAQQMQPDCHDLEILFHFERDIQDLEKEIAQWYNTLLEFYSRPQPTSPTIDQVMEIIDSVLESLAYFVRFCLWDSVEPIEATVEKIKFLRNFICFITLSRVDPRKLDNLLVHIQAVSVNAAPISHIYKLHKGGSNVSVLLQKFNSIDPRIYRTYTQALISCKLSARLHSLTDRYPLLIMKGFADSLLWNRLERLQMDTSIAISTSIQLQHLYEGVTLLRSMLQAQPGKFGKKIRELTRMVICDAGVIIFSLYQKDVEVVVSISGLLQSINCIRQRVTGKDLSIPDLLQKIQHTWEKVGANDLPRTNELGFIDFLLENLLEITSYEACYGFQSQLQMIHDELSLLRHFLGKIAEVRNGQKKLHDLWNVGVKVAYRVEILIDQLVLGDFQRSFSTSFDSTVKDIIKEIKTINSKFYHVSVQDIKVKKVSKTSNLVPSPVCAPVDDKIVGLDDDTTSIIERLTRGSKKLKIVAIVGMPGIGKTTLATKVFNHPSVAFHFHVRVWCCISQLFDRKKVFLELLNQILEKLPDKWLEMTEHDFAQLLRCQLLKRTYLVFLDDVWDTEVWNCLQESFPDDCCGSRIILTSRLVDAAPQSLLCDEAPHFARLLTKDESMKLLTSKLFPKTSWPQASYELGMQIAENCKGLPLTVVIVAGLLATLEVEGWEEVLHSLSSGIIFGTDHCMNTLEVSYKHLPDHLKPCFLYFGLFRKGQEVSVKRLLWLWIAEGFVCKTELKSLEDVARDYITDLVGRSLVIVSKKRSIGGVKACRIHDLLHDLCRTKAKEENFFQLRRRI